MDKQKLVAYTASLNKNLQYYLGKFEKNQQWADVAPLLLKIEGLLKQHPSPYIQEKIHLAKRLAQCLNPQLSAPIHCSVLKIYDQIFKNMANFSVEHPSEQTSLMLEDMAIFSNASSKVRPQYLELMSTHMVPLGRELIPMIAGLVASIVPGLDDQLESIQKQTMSVLDGAMQAVGRRYLMGAVWMSLLRCSKCRNGGIKYLNQRVSRLQNEEDDDDDGLDSDSDDSQAEDQTSVVVAGSKVDQPNVPQQAVVQTTVEEEEKQADLPDEGEESKAQNEIKKTVIVKEEASEYARKMELIELEEQIDEDVPENNLPNKSGLLVNALMACLEDDNQLVKRQVLDLMFTHLKWSYEYWEDNDIKLLVESVLLLLIRKDMSVTRRVNQWLFGKPDLENKYQITEANRLVIGYIIHAFNQILTSTPNDIYTATFPLKLLQNFFMEHEHMVELIMPSISIQLITYLKKYADHHQFGMEVLKAGKRLLESITSYLSLVTQALSAHLANVQLIHFLFDRLIIGKESYDVSTQLSLVRLCVANLFVCVSNSISEPGSQGCQLIHELLCKMDGLQESQQQQQEFMQMANGVQYDDAIDQFGLCYATICERTLEGDEEGELMFRYASQILVRGQRYRDEKTINKLPDWFGWMTRIVREESPWISLLAIESMIYILVSEKLDPVYNRLRALIIESTKSKQQQTDYTRLTLEKLWSLLDYQYFHERIIEMIVNLSRVFPTYFSDVVASQFNSQQVGEKEAAIRRFAVFWKLTSQYYGESSSQELNRVGLFLMLDFLDDENPIIRHTAKNWLLESITLLHRILDPLFEVLIQSSSAWYVTEKQQIFFAKLYETRRTHQTIKKLKSILLTFSDQFLRYVMTTELSQYIKDIRLHFTNETYPVITKDLQQTNNSLINNSLINNDEQQDMIPTQLQIESQQMTYLDLLVIICLKYIQGQAVESMSLKFYIENATVNASACEFIELLVMNIDHPLVSLRLAEYIMEPLQIVLYHAVDNNDYVMQIQLLNLFKVIFFHSAFRTKYSPSHLPLIQLTMTNTVSNPFFIPTLIRAINTTVLYVRSQYISFISTCIPLLAQHLNYQTLTSCVKSILNAYFQMIKRIADHHHQDDDDDDTQAHQITNSFDYIQGSSSHEISSVLAGVKTILKHILGLEERDDILYQKPKDAPSTIVGVVTNLLTFGLLNIQDTNKFALKLTFHQFQQTCEQIMLTLPSILELYINCWQLSPHFLSLAANNLTGLGTFPYYFDKYNPYNKLLQESFLKSNQIDKNIVKPQILTMMRPLFMHYSKQFMSAIMHIWTQQCSITQSLFAAQDGRPMIIDATQLHHNTFLLKTIELLVMMQCPADLLLDSLCESDTIKEIAKYHDQQRRKKLNTPVLSYQIAQQETAVLFFLYTYFTYAYVEPLKREALLILWTNLLTLLRVLTPSKVPSTNLWLIEFILLLTRKYSPKEIVADQRFRNEMHELVNEKLKYLSNFSAKNVQLFWNDPTQNIKKNIEEGDESAALEQYLCRFRIILPLSPSLYEIYNQVIEYFKNQGESTFEITEIEKIMFGQMGTIIEDELLTKYRLFCIKTIRVIGLEVLQNSYAVEKTDRVVMRCKEFMDPLFPVMENKALHNQIFVQTISELLFTLLEKAKQLLIKSFRQPILDLFNKEDFFIQNRQTLKYWGKIINWVVLLDKGDLFSEYLEKVSLQSSFFSKESEENKKRIKSFERICFVIFSGERDRYTRKLWSLIEKISEVIKSSETVHAGLLILILFCVRILILRLSAVQLNDLFRNIWPMLLTLLIQLFQRKGVSRNVNLVLSGLKLIEMISLTQQDDFYLHQWIFMYDFFGVEVRELNNEEREQISSKQITPFLYQPFIANFISKEDHRIHYINKCGATNTQQKKLKRNIIIQYVKVDSEVELQSIALQLCQYLIQINEQRTYVEPEQVEELIENDFIHLDEFIFTI